MCECQPPLPSFAHLNHTPHQPLPNLTSTSTIPQPFPQALLNLTTSSNTTYLNLNSLQPQPTLTTPKSYLHLNHTSTIPQALLNLTSSSNTTYLNLNSAATLPLIHPLIKPLPATSCYFKTSYTHAHQTVARLFPS